jgi:hypothetical protein
VGDFMNQIRLAMASAEEAKTDDNPQ